MTAVILHGDSKELLKTLPDNSVDSVVTDPPYEYEFMNARWDGTGIAFDLELWAQVFRVLKPGGYAAVFGADRRIHRVMCALEDVGFIIRHLGEWATAQVFPKSVNASKAIDEKLGKTAERQVVGPGTRHDSRSFGSAAGDLQYGTFAGGVPQLTVAATPEAAKWEGFGTALKTMEPWVLVRKPLEGTIAENILKWGVGALNIDGCRLPGMKEVPVSPGGRFGRNGIYSLAGGQSANATGLDPEIGRWPSMLVCSDLDLEGPVLGVEVFGAEDDELDGVLGPYTKHFRIGGHDLVAFPDEWMDGIVPTLVICPKVGPAERELGCESMEERWVDPSRAEDGAGRNNPRAGAGRKAKRKNIHPTVKPISLIRHIIRLVTPPGGTVLDTFAGSASGGMAAVWEGMSYIGMELNDTDEQPFVRIGRARVEYALKTPAPPIQARVVKPPPVQERKQLDLF